MSTDRQLRLELPSDTDIEYSWRFNAPIDQVFRAFTEVDLLKKWLLGPDGWTLPICEIDLRVGGAIRYVWRSEADGSEIEMQGEFTEIEVPAKFVATERYVVSWYPGEARNTTTFSEENGRTTVTTLIRYDSKEARDIVLQAPMETGVLASYLRLEGVLGE